MLPHNTSIFFFFSSQLESNYDRLIDVLRQRQQSCSQFRVDKDCDLEVLRQKMYTKAGITYELDAEKLCNKSAVSDISTQPNLLFYTHPKN